MKSDAIASRMSRAIAVCTNRGQGGQPAPVYSPRPRGVNKSFRRGRELSQQAEDREFRAGDHEAVHCSVSTYVKRQNATAACNCCSATSSILPRSQASEALLQAVGVEVLALLAERFVANRIQMTALVYLPVLKT